MALPVIVLVCFAIVQVGAVARHDVLVAHAAREAARAAAVEPDLVRAREAATDAARRAVPLGDGRLVITLSRSDREVRVEARYVDPTNVPLVGSLVGDVTLTAVVVMHREDIDS